MAAFDLIDEGIAIPDRIPWCQAIRNRFTSRFNLLRKHNDQNNPDLPYRYLAGDGFWSPLEADGDTLVRWGIRVSDCGQVFARFTGGFQFLVAIPENRRKMREALVARYFPHHAAALLSVADPQSTISDPPSRWPKSPKTNQNSAAPPRSVARSSKSTTTNALLAVSVSPPPPPTTSA